MKRVKRVSFSRNFLRALIIEEYVLMILLVVGLCFFVSDRADAHHGSKKGTVVIDAGHGGVDGGTYYGDLLEKDINLKISLELRSVLIQKGYDVVLTRSEDIALDKLNNSSSSRHERDLNARVDIINSSSADVFVSIHVNSRPGDPSENGSSVFYMNVLEQNKALAQCIQDQLNMVTFDGYTRKTHEPQIGRFFILGYADIPGVLVETGFITNWQDRELLTTDAFIAKIAGAVADGVDAYMKTK
jgi:N-acetylmuramoyl-L-alanine amidase